ncbi:response regulator [Pseudoroseomonas wenyumeiae]|uniref:Response regulator n=1 Tax=Teichococcus wenyumeiae TaxID=2478470 RepID=A0A3A9JIF9_9PROT|nr:response regulator [Pseudoroseomonas wenyumeiae]RKK03464.1 response regulator [Pseudoroseomonas wenyumeiae]RMI20502.1 response regulator [Pseudoroseomonas wenyumeiae]
MTDCPDDERRAALNGHRILVAEDEVPVAMMMEDTIIDAGGMVLGPVISVPDALGLLDAAKADGGVSAAVINLRLGQHRTTRLAAALREQGVPFLYATGYGTHHDLDAHQEVPVLAKPYNPADLVEALEGLLSCRA